MALNHKPDNNSKGAAQTAVVSSDRIPDPKVSHSTRPNQSDLSFNKSCMRNITSSEIVSCATKSSSSPSSFSENKENIPITTPNYAILYQLYLKFKNWPNPEQMWPLIGHSYNISTNSKYSAKEIVKIWNHMPAMVKRKCMIDSFVSSDDDAKPNNKKMKKLTTNSMVAAKETINATSSNDLKGVFESQPEPIDFTCKKGSKKMKVTFKDNNFKSENIKLSKVDKLNNNDKYTQTEQLTTDNDSETEREEQKLKLSILQLKLKYMRLQYKNKFG